MARTDRPGEAVGGGSGLGSPISRARLAVSQNQKNIAQKIRTTKNNEIKAKAKTILTEKKSLKKK